MKRYRILIEGVQVRLRGSTLDFLQILVASLAAVAAFRMSELLDTQSGLALHFYAVGAASLAASTLITAWMLRRSRLRERRARDLIHLLLVRRANAQNQRQSAG